MTPANPPSSSERKAKGLFGTDRGSPYHWTGAQRHGGAYVGDPQILSFS